MPDNCLGDEPSVWEVTEGPAEGLLTGEGERVKAAEAERDRLQLYLDDRFFWGPGWGFGFPR